MADYYTQTYFEFRPTEAEIMLLREVDRYEDDVDGRTVTTSPEFAAAFPSKNDDKLSGFRNFLESEELDHLCCAFADQLDYQGGVARYKDDEMHLTYVSVLLQKVCRSALPITFQWATVCSSFRDEDFGGGVTIIEESGITGWSSMDALEEARARLVPN